MAGKVLGIDLGTTYSCVSWVNQYGKPEVILNQNNERTTPSVVWFDGDHAVVGQQAKEMGSIHPDAVCSFIKRQMGNDDYTFDVRGVEYSPVHISSLILRKLVQDAWARIGEEVRDVVITCPAYFFIKERDATKLAGEQAGLNVLQIVNEPTAAAVAYGIQSERSDSNKSNTYGVQGESSNSGEVILIYDLGGGTFDVTVMKVTPNGLDVVCTDGDHQLGGKDWDDQLAKYFARRVEEEIGKVVDLAGDSEFYYDLMQQAEETKKHLSEKSTVTVRINYAGEKVRFDITREEFEDLTQSLLERTIDLTFSCFDVAGTLGIERLDHVILVGGSSRMPQVAAKLKKELELGYLPDLFDPDEAIAKGAAIIGNNIILRKNVEEKLSAGNHSRSLLIDDATDEQKNIAINKVVEETGYTHAIISGALKSVRNVVSKSFGIVSTNDNGFRYVSNIIYRNTPIPCVDTQTFLTSCDGQQVVLVELMENSQDRSPTFDQDCEEIQQTFDQTRYDELWGRIYASEDNSGKLWDGELAIYPGLRRGSPIDITFKLDENGLLTLIATDLASGNRLVQTIHTGVSQENAEFKQATKHSRNLIVD